jgi:hypothetical protein
METNDDSFRLESTTGGAYVFQGHRIARAVANEVDSDGIPRTVTVTLYRTTDGLLHFYASFDQPDTSAHRYVYHAEYQYDQRIVVLPGAQDWYQASFKAFAAAEELVKWLRQGQSEHFVELLRQAANADPDVRRWYHG